MVKINCGLTTVSTVVSARGNSNEAPSTQQPELGLKCRQTLVGVICVLTVIIFVLFGLLIKLWCSGQVLPQTGQQNASMETNTNNTRMQLKWETVQRTCEINSSEFLEMRCSIEYSEKRNITVACQKQPTKLTLAKLQGICCAQSKFRSNNENNTWLAQLIASSGNIVCDGTLISDRHVLTAAHCALKEIASVRLGQHNCDKCEGRVQTIQMKTAVIHEFYDSSKMTNDIALVILKQAANIKSSFVRPICLPLATATLNSGNSMELRLTGSNFETRRAISRTVSFLEKRKCKKNTSAQLDDRKLCVDLVDGSSIESGAVLHSLNKDNTGVIQYGIATFGGSGATGVFLKVSYYIDWILNHSE